MQIHGIHEPQEAKKKVITPDGGPTTAAKLEEAFSELVQFLDSRSLHLIMREAKDNGREAMRILREHYAGRGKQRIVSLYKSLCSLRKDDHSDLTDYIIKGETVAAALKSAGEVISDGLLQSMLLNGLPESYKPFEDIITQKEKVMTFSDFKVAIRNYEENRRVSIDSIGNQFSSVMKVRENLNERNEEERGRERYNNSNNNNENRSWNRGNSNGYGRNGRNNNECYRCGEFGHKSFECPNKVGPRSGVWCDYCESPKHSYQSCRNRVTKTDEVKVVREENSSLSMDGAEHSFVFGVREGRNHKRSGGDDESNELIVDSGSTDHIINDKKKFIDFDNDYTPEENYMELADGRRITGAAERRGTAEIRIRDDNGRMRVVKSGLLGLWRSGISGDFQVFLVKFASNSR